MDDPRALALRGRGQASLADEAALDDAGRRGDTGAARHRGALAVLDADGTVHTQWGDIDRPIFPRSAVKVLQALPLVASGAAETVPYLMVTNLARTLGELKERDLRVIGTSDDAERTLYDVDLSGPVALVLGAEGPGMRALTKKTCDVLVRIPMAGAVESLNVSVATGMLLYEALRQRGREMAAVAGTRLQVGDLELDRESMRVARAGRPVALTARELALAQGVPLLPGSGLLADLAEAEREAERIGYPVMLKSSAGGGGIGMQMCPDADALRGAFASVKNTSLNSESPLIILIGRTSTPGWSIGTSRKVMPTSRCRFCNSNCISARNLRSSAASGSSSNNTVGSVASVMAISSWRCSPWLTVAATVCVRWVRPASSMARSQRSLTTFMAAADCSQRSGFQGACRSRDCAARRTLSQTVKGRKMLVFW